MSQFSEISARFSMLYASVYASAYRKVLNQPIPFESELSKYSAFKKSIRDKYKGLFSSPEISHDSLGVGDFFTTDFNGPIGVKKKVIDKEFNSICDYIFDVSFLAKCGFTAEDINSLNVGLLKDSCLNRLLVVNENTSQALMFNVALQQKGLFRDVYNLIITAFVVVGCITAGLGTMGVGSAVGLFIWFWYRSLRRKKDNYKAQVKLLETYKQYLVQKDKQILSLSGIKHVYSSVEDLMFGRALYQILMNIASLCDEKGKSKARVMKLFEKRLVKIHDHFYKKYESDVDETESLLRQHTKEYSDLKKAKIEDDIKRAKEQVEWEKTKSDVKKEFNKLRSKLAEAIDSKPTQ